MNRKGIIHYYSIFTHQINENLIPNFALNVNKVYRRSTQYLPNSLALRYLKYFVHKLPDNKQY